MCARRGIRMRGESDEDNRTYFKRAALGVVAALAGVIVVCLIAQAFDANLRVDAFGGDDQEVTIPSVIFATLFQGVLATVIGWVLYR